MPVNISPVSAVPIQPENQYHDAKSFSVTGSKLYDTIELIRATLLQPEQIDGPLTGMVRQVITAHKSNMDPHQVMMAVKKEISKDDFLKQFTEPFAQAFTQDEIRSLTGFYRSETMKKFCKTSPENFGPIFAAIQSVVNNIVAPVVSDNSNSTDPVAPLTELNYQKEISEFDGTAVLEVYSSFCAPCQSMIPIFAEVGHDLRDKAKFLKLNVSNELKLARELEIHSVPTVLVFKNGKIVDQHIGLISKADLTEKINKICK